MRVHIIEQKKKLAKELDSKSTKETLASERKLGGGGDNNCERVGDEDWKSEVAIGNMRGRGFVEEREKNKLKGLRRN